MTCERPKHRSGPPQFSLAELLLWVTGVGVGLSAIRCLGVSSALWIVPLGAYLLAWRLEGRFTLPLFSLFVLGLLILFVWMFIIWTQP